MNKTHFTINLSAAQRRNLETLYAHLEKVERIYMPQFAFRTDPDDDADEDNSTPRAVYDHPCGTVGCLAGNGPAAGIKPRHGESWVEYVSRVFGAKDISWDDATEESDRLWSWLFDASWYHVDNTVAGGRARIRIALDQGIPNNYGLQMQGLAKLSYAA